MSGRRMRAVPNGVVVALDGAGYKRDALLSTTDLEVWLHPTRAVRVEVSAPTTPGLDKVFLSLVVVDPAAPASTRKRLEFLSSEDAIQKIRAAGS